MSNKTWPEYPPQGVAPRPNRAWVLIIVAFAAALGFVLSARNAQHATGNEPPAASVQTQEPQHDDTIAPGEQPSADTPAATEQPSDKLRGRAPEAATKP